MTLAPPWMASSRGGKGRRKRSRRRNDRCLWSHRWSGRAQGEKSIHIGGERPHDAGFLKERRVVGPLAAGLLYDAAQAGPFWLAAVGMLATAALASRLPDAVAGSAEGGLTRPEVGGA